MCCASCSQEAGNWNINGELVTDPWLCSHPVTNQDPTETKTHTPTSLRGGCVRSTARSTFTVNGASIFHALLRTKH